MKEKYKVGFALCGSFCTFDSVISQLEQLSQLHDVTPIMSFNAYELDTKFGKACDFIKKIENTCNKKIINSIIAAEPIGPNKMFDILIVAPCTGNTISKITNGITDTPVTMAVKSHIRNDRPVVIAVSTNDALSGSASNIGTLLNRKNFYFVPMKQDNPLLKPRSMVADMSKINVTIEKALQNIQIQPIIF